MDPKLMEVCVQPCFQHPAIRGILARVLFSLIPIERKILAEHRDFQGFISFLCRLASAPSFGSHVGQVSEIQIMLGLNLDHVLGLVVLQALNAA